MWPMLITHMKIIYITYHKKNKNHEPKCYSLKESTHIFLDFHSPPLRQGSLDLQCS